jgi:PEGA domain-containing protein
MVLWPFLDYPAPDGYAPYPFDTEGITGGLRLKVEPKEAQVYVDGYYAGIVDDFNGHFQRLKLIPGLYHLEIRASGYQPLVFEIRVEAFETTEYRGTLQRLPR